uniref:Ig-like domain-containing protein n=1 Tax=Equus caballus TaxID=9796 RepID=A0A3Q2I411_HORSE
MGVCTQVQLMQSAPEVKSPGQSLRISCKTSGYAFTSYWISWFCQMPGKGLEWIGMIYPGDLDTCYGTSFQGHVMIPMKNSISTSYLHSVTAEDMAVYYCSRVTASQCEPRHKPP